MSQKHNRDRIVGLDIGTSKVAAIVGEFDPEGHLTIKGFGLQPSTGLKRGVVVNIDSTVNSIQRAVEEAETMAGCSIDQTFTGIAGSHINGMNSHGIVAIKDQEVTPFDIAAVIDAAKAVAIPADQKILHILPQEFIIDNQGGIREPVGMSGVRLEAKVHMVTGGVSAAQNIIKCVKRCGLNVNDIILEQLASSYAVLTEDEKELGVCLVDIGGGTTDIAIFTEGAIRHTAVIPVAGDQVTNDLAVALRVPRQCAESIKIEHACAMVNAADTHQTVTIPSVGNRESRQCSSHMLAQVVEPRYEELFTLIKSEIRKHGFEMSLGAGIVLTGGGSKVPHLIPLAEHVFNTSVRLGDPREQVSGDEKVISNPSYATSIGLLLYGRQQQMEDTVLSPTGVGMRGAWGKMKGWFQGNF